MPEPGPIEHIEIPAPDLEKAKAFYSRVFEWTLQPMNEDYVLFRSGSVGGGLDRAGEVAETGVTLVITVPDIAAKLEEIRAAGGSVVKEKTAIGPEHGFYAYFRDPNGNRLGLWSRT